MGILTWIRSKLSGPIEKSTSASTPNAPTSIRGRDPRPFLAGSAPGMWSSNHLDEARNVTGFQFVAIRQKATMCSNAELKIHLVEDRADLSSRLAKVERSIRKSQKISDPVERTYKTERLEQKRQLLSDRLHKMATGTGPESVKGDRTPVDSSHPLYRLLSRPNPEWSGSTFIYALSQQISSTGVGLVWCIRNGAGVPVELYVIPTGLAVPRLPTPAYPQGSYYITPISAWGVAPNDIWNEGAIGQAMLTGAEIDRRDVKKICWPHSFFLTDGQSPMAAGSLWVDLGNEMDRASWYRFQNAERPGMIFKRDKDIDPDPADVAQFREDLKADASGTPNTGKHLILPPGIEAVSWNNTERELEFVGSRPQVRDMNLALHGMTPISCGFAEAQAYSAYWAAIKQTTELSVQPLLGLIGGELTELLGTAFDGCRYEIGYNAPSIDDPQLLESRLQTDIDAGNVLLVSEYRAMRGLPLLGDERDDQFVGEVTNVRVQAQDADPNLPGIQVEDKGETEGGDKGKSDKSGKDGPGVKSPFKAAPGRQDLNGKSLRKRRRRSPISKAVEWDESKHPRDGGRFSEKPGSDSGGSDDSGDERESADENHDRFESMTLLNVDKISDAAIDSARAEHGKEFMDCKAVEPALDDLQSSLQSNAETLIAASAELRDAIAIRSEVRGGERDDLDEDTASDLVDDAGTAFDVAKEKYEKDNNVAVSDFERSVAFEFSDLESSASDMADAIDEYDEDAGEDANSRLERAGNPFRIEWDEGSESWYTFIPSEDGEVSKRMRPRAMRKALRQLDKSLNDLPAKIGEAMAKVAPSQSVRKRHVELVVDPETERIKGMDITEE